MLNVKFLNEESIKQVDIKQISPNVVEITGTVKNTSGFHVLDDDGNVRGKYEDYTTIYRELDESFFLSNDNSVYTEPESIPESEPHEPTLQEVQELKVAEMNYQQQETIASGVNVKLSNGFTENFPLTQYDQQSLMGLQSRVLAGDEKIPWHNSNESEHCKFYSNADMALIISTALAHVTYHVTYFRDLRIYIRSLNDKEVIQSIVYGTPIPEGQQSEVLETMITQQYGDV